MVELCQSSALPVMQQPHTATRHAGWTTARLAYTPSVYPPFCFNCQTAMDAREALVSAGSGRPWFLLRWHPLTAVSTGKHHLAGRSAMVAPLSSWLLLCPDPFQRLTKLPLAQGSCQFPFPEDAADPPDLQTTEGKGNQTQLEVSRVQVVHYVGSCFC